jgi:hypothetical protein
MVAWASPSDYRSHLYGTQRVERKMMITNNGKPIAIPSSISENDLEQVLSASWQVRASSAVAALQFDSVKKGTDKISMEEIDSEISVR